MAAAGPTNMNARTRERARGPWANARADGRADGRAGGRADGRADGRTRGRMGGRTDGRTGAIMELLDVCTAYAASIIVMAHPLNRRT